MKVNVNDVVLNYDVVGSGYPIILLHGNGENYTIFNKLIDKLKEDYTVYAVDSRCHGESDDTEEVSYNLMAEDIIGFIKELNIENPMLYGFSDGGIVGLLIAMKEPELLSKLIVSGVNINPKGLKNGTYLGMKVLSTFTRNKLIKMMVNEPDIKIEELNKIKIPTVLLVGDRDCIKLSHTKLIHRNIPNSKLEIVKRAGHSNYIIGKDRIYHILKKYIENT